MRYYPAFLDLHGRKCLLVGCGGVGSRKLSTLLACDPQEVLVVDPCASVTASDRPDATPLTDERVTLKNEAFEESDLNGRFLVIAASADRELNTRIADLCKERNILCNIADAPERCSFVVPAHAALDDMTVAVSTGGQSPALARRIRRDLQEYLSSRYTVFLTFMGRLRPELLGLGEKTEHNTAVFRALVNSELAPALERGDEVRARSIIREILPPELHSKIGDLLDGLI